MIIHKKINMIYPLVKHTHFLKTPETILTSSILLETACTVCLTKVNENKLWYIPIYTGYGLSFYLFPKALDKYSLNLAYTVRFLIFWEVRCLAYSGESQGAQE